MQQNPCCETFTVDRPLIAALILAAAALSGCGGGSAGINGPTNSGQGEGGSTSSGYTISGVVSKGFVASATVTAYCGPQSSGSTWGKAATTDSGGNYSITGSTACSSPLEVVATPTEGVTTYLDETTGQPINATFTLKAYLASLQASNTLHITPLSDVVAAMVDGQGAAPTSTSVTAAINSVITNVLSGDSATYNATPMTPAQALASANVGNMRLAYLLTAIDAEGYVITLPEVQGGRNVSQAVTTLISGLEQTAVASNAAGQLVQRLQKYIGDSWNVPMTGPSAPQLINSSSALPTLTPPGSTSQTYTIGGSVTGLTGSGLVLVDTLGDSTSVSANGTFSFQSPMSSGSPASIRVAKQPTGQLCSVAPSAPAVISGANISDIAVQCVPGYTLSGTLKGLASSASIVLDDNAGDQLTVSASGTFTFPSAYLTGAPWTVSIAANPQGQSCSFTQGNQLNSGVIENFNVQVGTIQCESIYPISVSVSGLGGGTSVSVQLIGAGARQTLTLNENGTQSFQGGATAGTQFETIVTSSPSEEGCQFSGGTLGGGIVSASSDNTVQLTCVNGYFSIGGTVSGLAAGSSLVLKETTALEPADTTFTITANGPYTLPANVLGYVQGGTESGYSVVFVQQPPNQNCVWAGGVGLASAEAVVKNVTDLNITCTPAYTLSGTLSGIANSIVDITGTTNFPGMNSNTLQLNSNGAFSTVVPPGTYVVTPWTASGTLTWSPPSATVTVTDANPTALAFMCVAGCQSLSASSGGSVGGSTGGTVGGSGAGSSTNGNGGGTYTCNFSSCASPLPNCVSTFLDPNEYDWYSLQSNCSENVAVSFSVIGGQHIGQMNLAPGQSESTGLSSSEAPEGFTVAICPIEYNPWNPIAGQAWNGSDSFICAAE